MAASNVVIGMDPHKRSATIEVMSSDESVVGGGRFATDAVGYRAMLTYAKQWPARTWAIEGSNGIGRHIAMRLVADGETVVDVPAKLSARARVFVSGQGRKTDAWRRALGRAGRYPDSVVCIRSSMMSSAPCCGSWSTAADALGEDHTRMTSQLHVLLLELIPGGAKKDLSAAQARQLLATVRPRDAAGKHAAGSPRS